MTRFEMELSGKLGDFWKRNAEQEIAWIQEKVDNGEILLDENCAAYWKSNGQYIPSDCVEKLKHTGFLFDAEATNEAEHRQIAEFMNRNRNKKSKLSDEERFELRAAFGKGAKIVNVITGETFIA